MSLNDKKRWNARYSQQSNWRNHPPKNILIEYSHLIPKNSIVLDAAAGLGGNGRYLSEKGHTVISLDISVVGILKSKQMNIASNLNFIGAVYDLSNPWMPKNYFDAILNFSFLERKCFSAYKKALKPNGLLFFQTFLKNPKDSEEKIHYLEKGELLKEFQDFRIIFHNIRKITSGIKHSNRQVEQLVAQKII